jgi:hypothetical protein
MALKDAQVAEQKFDCFVSESFEIVARPHLSRSRSPSAGRDYDPAPSTGILISLRLALLHFTAGLDPIVRATQEWGTSSGRRN